MNSQQIIRLIANKLEGWTFNGRDGRAYCPKCGHEDRKFYFSPKKGLGHCKHCKYSPNAKVLLKDLQINEEIEDNTPTQEEYFEALETLDDEIPQLNIIDLPKEAEPAWKHTKAMAYLLGRISVKEIVSLQVHYCPYGDYQFRIIIPCIAEGKNVGFVARSISPMAKAKYLYPEKLKKSAFLWNFDTAQRFDEIVITEGVFDALRVGPDAIATFGKDLSKTQLVHLITCGIKGVTLLWDEDAREQMIETANLLCTKIPTKISFIQGADAGDTNTRQLRQLIGLAQPWTVEKGYLHSLELA